MQVVSWNRSNIGIWRKASLNLSLKPMEKCSATPTTQCRLSSVEHSWVGQSLDNRSAWCKT